MSTSAEGSTSRPWLLAALAAGVAYVVIGRVFAWPATHVQAWRYLAWVASGVVFWLHFAIERTRWRHAPRAIAVHTALGVAIGAFLLAVAGMVHNASAGEQLGARWLIALVAWPAITAIPAFLVALVAATVLARRTAAR